jgi:hypothetical protein
VDDDRRGLVGDARLDVALEVAAGDVEGPGDRSLRVLLGLAHVEDHGAGAAPGLVGLGGADLSDLRLGGGEELTEAGHRWTSLFDRVRSRSVREENPTGGVNNQARGSIPGVSPSRPPV